MNNIFKAEACLTEEVIKAYLKQTLKGGQLHQVERHLVDCPLCSAAVEGLSQADDLDQELQENTYRLKRQNTPKVEESPDRSYKRPNNEYDLAAEPDIQRISYLF